MVFYFILTGLHAVHMLIGLGVLSGLAILAIRGNFRPMDTMIRSISAGCTGILSISSGCLFFLCSIW